MQRETFRLCNKESRSDGKQQITRGNVKPKKKKKIHIRITIKKDLEINELNSNITYDRNYRNLIDVADLPNITKLGSCCLEIHQNEWLKI